MTYPIGLNLVLFLAVGYFVGESLGHPTVGMLLATALLMADAAWWVWGCRRAEERHG